jgi:hypothetical protein
MAVENILEIFSRATEWDRAAGRDWYFGAWDWCKKTASEYNVTPEHVAALVAILSPRNRWVTNLRDAEGVLEAVRNGETPMNFTAHTTNKFKFRAFDFAITGDFDLIRGQKVNSFFDNITRPHESEEVTVDVWAERISIGDLHQPGSTLTAKKYQALVAEYREAAAALGLRPLVLQAITWVVARRLAKVRTTGKQLPLF